MNRVSATAAKPPLSDQIKTKLATSSRRRRADISKNKLEARRDLSGQQLGLDTVEKLARELSTDVALTSLNLFNCGLGSEAVNALAAALRSNTVLQSLRLGHAKAGASGDALASLLADNRSLTLLDLSWSCLETPALCKIFNALPASTVLSLLKLRYVRLSQEALAALSAALLRAPSLIALDLSHCGIQEDAMGRLISAVRIGGQLDVEVADNPISKRQESELKAVLMTNLRQSNAARQLSRCLPPDIKWPPELSAEILRRVPLDDEGLETLRGLMRA